MHTNPLFDTREYKIEFTDGSREMYMANIIAENIFAQVDDEGHQFQIIDMITDHCKDNSVVPISNGMIRNANGMAKPKKTTRGWELLMQFKHGSMDWVKLKGLKASNPIKLAEYAVANRLIDELAFKWWVPHTIWKQNQIIKKVKSWYWRTMQMFGV